PTPLPNVRGEHDGSPPKQKQRTERNWPRFRGADGSGVSTAKSLPLTWSGTKNIVWKTPLPGHGASSPIICGDHVYVTCYSGYGLSLKAPGEMADLKRHLVCVAWDNGKILWTATLPSSA